MSNHLNSLFNLLSMQTIQEIDNLDLPIMQKHHVRILAHCLQILKVIKSDKYFENQNKNLLREWCDNQSKKFDDKKFSDLFYEQLEQTSKKLSNFSKKIGKTIDDLEIDDLVLLVEQCSSLFELIPKKKYIFVESLTNSGNKI